MHRDQRADVCAVQPGSPLPQSPEPIYQLHVCGRQLGTDVASGRKHGPQLPPVHTGGKRLTEYNVANVVAVL